MKKSELKNIIKECVKELIFEEGILSGIVTEVATGLSLKTIQEVQAPHTQGPSMLTSKSDSRQIKKQVLDAVANNSYADVKKRFSNPELFEGTSPIPSGGSQGALSGVPSGDSGVDISNIPGFSKWSSVAAKTK
jgi:hypothetical protein